jgi:hypothetical protein
MSLILSGSDGLSDIDGSASTPAIRGTDANTGIFFPAADTIAFAEGGAEAMRIDSSGNVGIGTTSQTQRLEVYNAATNSQCYAVVQNNRARNAAVLTKTTNGGFYTGTSIGTDTLCWQVYDETNAERMRIDSSGNLLVGITTASGKVRFQQTADATTLTLTSAQAGFLSSNQSVLQITTTAGSSNPTASFAIRSSYNGSGVFDARNDGTLYAQNTTVQSISDVRTKENIRDAEDGLDVITALRPVRFDFKEGFNNNRKNQLGFIAQEIEQVFPDAVDVSPQEDENGDPYKSVGPGALIPVLVKAIQELKAELDTVKAQNAAFEARLAALEAK